MERMSQNTGEDEDEEIPSTSGLVALRSGNFPLQDVIPHRDTRISRQSDIVPSRKENRSTTIIDGGNYQAASIGNRNTVNNITNISITRLEGANGGQSAPKKRKVAEESKTRTTDITRINEITYFNRKERLSKSSLVFKGGIESKVMTTEDVAVKVNHLLSEEEAIMLKGEVSKIVMIKHQHVVRHLSAHIAAHHMAMYLVMEMCMTENLHDHVKKMRRQGKRFSFADCKSSVRQLSSALKYLHKRDILHRDIKPSNILFSLDGNYLKLADFAFGKPDKPERSSTANSSKRIGSDSWRAPETILEGRHEKKSDVYSLGLLSYFIWSNGEHAFGDDPDLVNHNIKMNTNRNLTKISFCDPEKAKQLTKLTERMLEFLEEKRISASELASDELCRSAENELENWEGEDYRPLQTIDEIEYRKPQRPCLVVFERKRNSLYAFEPRHRSWTRTQPLDPNIIGWNLTAVRFHDYIYAFLENRRVFRIKYTVENTVWEVQDNMLLDHGDLPPTTLLGDCIYAIGQSTPKSLEPRRGERFDTTKLSWSLIPNMKTKRERHTVIACNGSVYSIGGIDCGHQPVDATTRGEKFDPVTENWSPIAPMNGSRYGASATSLEDKIYIFGGAGHGIIMLKDGEVYDTKTDAWTRIAEMNTPRLYFGAVTVDGKIYAVNGHAQSPLTIEEYDTSKKKWEFVVEGSSKDLWPCACVSIIPRNESR